MDVHIIDDCWMDGNSIILMYQPLSLRLSDAYSIRPLIDGEVSAMPDPAQATYCRSDLNWIRDGHSKHLAFSWNLAEDTGDIVPSVLDSSLSY